MIQNEIRVDYRNGWEGLLEEEIAVIVSSLIL